MNFSSSKILSAPSSNTEFTPDRLLQQVQKKGGGNCFSESTHVSVCSLNFDHFVFRHSE
jgi:hypothetical protein